MTGTRRIALTATLAAMLFVLSVPVSQAAHHLVRIRQVYTDGAGMEEFVLLQLTAAGENQLFTTGPASIRLYDATNLTLTQEFIANPPNGENQRAVLVATHAAETAFGASADLEPNDDNYMDDAAGAACLRSNPFPDIDCVEWGAGTTQVLPSATRTLEPAIPAGMMLQRSIAANCSTFFETADDTNDSAADFAPATLPAMGTFRNNASPIVETACGPGGGGGGGGGSNLSVATCAGKDATLTGTDAKETLTGTGGPDVIAGLGGNDTIRGLGGNDALCGGAGRDKLLGGGGADKMLGQGGNDTCTGGGGVDKPRSCETERSI